MAVAKTADVDLERMEIYVTGALNLNIDKTIADLELSIMNMELAGMSEEGIKATLIRDLQQGGVLFGGFRSGVKNTVKTAVQLASNDGSMQKYNQSDVKKWKWIVVSENPCPDCIPRHNRIEVMQHWRDVGLPGSGFSICREFCKCKLVPSSYKGENLENPVVREKRSQRLKYIKDLNPKQFDKYRVIARQKTRGEITQAEFTERLEVIKTGG